MFKVSGKGEVDTMTDGRVNWDEAAMLTALTWALRSPYCNHKVGCVILSGQHELLGQGYNDAPSGMPHCFDTGCRKLSDGSCVGLHAEDNAISHVKEKNQLRGATIYITLQPCVKCSCRIVKWGFARVVAASRYLRIPTVEDFHVDEFDQSSLILSEAGIKFEWFQPESKVAVDLVRNFERLIKIAIKAK